MDASCSGGMGRQPLPTVLFALTAQTSHGPDPGLPANGGSDPAEPILARLLQIIQSAACCRVP
jgi:hypothetical protein